MASQTKEIRFHFLTAPFYFPRRSQLKHFIQQSLSEEGKEIDAINYIFCDDDYLLSLNKQYLNHNTLTDIITFELSPKGQPLLSDIFISIQRVRENAFIHDQHFSSELLRVIFHGALHLCGYKDKKSSDATLMRAMEDNWLTRYRVSRGTKGRED
jgi:rRNA maturation RNase YbeY